MLTALRNFWDKSALAGTAFADSEREKGEVILINKAWMILMIIQSICLVFHLLNGSHRTALMTAFYIAGLSLIRPLLKRGYINASKISAIAVINLNTLLMAIFLGVETHVIDFLLLTALLPMYLFEVKNRKLIFWGVAISVIPYLLYYSFYPSIYTNALPAAEQLKVFKTTTWVMILCLITLLYLIYNKNVIYETEVLEKEKQLTGQKKLYERILEQIPIDIVTFDKELKFSFVNSKAIADPDLRKWMIGKGNAEYFTYRNLDMKGAQERERLLKDALAQEMPMQSEESILDRHGEIKYSLKGASPIYTENKDELLCLVGYSLDITGIKQAERKLKQYAIELEKKNEDLHHFVNATSHDLKTPLRNIISYLQLIEKKNIGKLDDDSLSMIAYTIKSVKHLNQLITDIYRYSVADSDSKPGEITDLNLVVKEVLQDMSHILESKNVAVRVDTLPVLKLAPSHIAMIINNLVGNAIKYNRSQQPLVEIGCDVMENEVIMRVSDNGIGIKKEYSKQIFQMFQRLHTSDEFEGTGVGLAICNKIAENYGGRMWVESEPGKGATFYFSLLKEKVSPEPAGNSLLSSFDNLVIAN